MGEGAGQAGSHILPGKPQHDVSGDSRQVFSLKLLSHRSPSLCGVHRAQLKTCVSECRHLCHVPTECTWSVRIRQQPAQHCGLCILMECFNLLLGKVLKQNKFVSKMAFEWSEVFILLL